MASCEVGLGPSILTKVGLWQIKDASDTIKAFVEALSLQLSSFFKAGAIASARELPCPANAEDTSNLLHETSRDQPVALLSRVPRDAFPVVDISLQSEALKELTDPVTVNRSLPALFTRTVAYRLSRGVTPVGEQLFIPSPAAFMAIAGRTSNKCCAFFGKVVSYGDVTLELDVNVKYGATDVAVHIKLGYTTGIAGATHRGFCNPPQTCEDESIEADILVTYTGNLKVTVGQEIDLGPLGKVKGGGVGVTLAIQGVDLVRCTVKCGSSA